MLQYYTQLQPIDGSDLPVWLLVCPGHLLQPCRVQRDGGPGRPCAALLVLVAPFRRVILCLEADIGRQRTHSAL